MALNLSQIYFIPLPYGTGNDLSVSLGWGPTEGEWGVSLEKLLITIIYKGKKDYVSLWDISVFTDQVYKINGKRKDEIFNQFMGQKSKPQSHVSKHSEEEKEMIFDPYGGQRSQKSRKDSSDQKSFKKLMLCYFNLGLDAWISNEFEEYRTKKRWTNKAYYFYLFLKLGCCTCDMTRIKNILDSVYEIDTTTNERTLIFKSSQIKDDPVLMFGTNIPSNYASDRKESNWFKYRDKEALVYTKEQKERLIR